MQLRCILMQVQCSQAAGSPTEQWTTCSLTPLWCKD